MNNTSPVSNLDTRRKEEPYQVKIAITYEKDDFDDDEAVSLEMVVHYQEQHELRNHSSFFTNVTADLRDKLVSIILSHELE